MALCAGNSPVPSEIPERRPMTRGFDVFFDLCLNKRLSKQSWGWWFETPSRPLWRHRNECLESSRDCLGLIIIIILIIAIIIIVVIIVIVIIFSVIIIIVIVVVIILIITAMSSSLLWSPSSPSSSSSLTTRWEQRRSFGHVFKMLKILKEFLRMRNNPQYRKASDSTS